VSPTKATVPAKTTVQTKAVVPAKAAVPGKTVVPAKATVPTKAVVPAKAAVPAKTAIPAKAAVAAKAVPPAKPVAPAKAVVQTKAAVQEKAVASSTPVETAPAPYLYNPAHKADPFRPFIETDLAKKKKIEVKKKSFAISPLQRADIEEFKLVGIGGDAHHRTAVVEQGKGKYYPLFKGSWIGQNNGRVVEILSDRVIVEEPLGKSKVKRLVMKLRETQDEGKP
jgi:type IV pilus assembly protein PilP